MDNPTTVMDVAVRWRPITDPDEDAQVQAYLDDAWSLLTDRLPSLPTDLDAGTPSAATVRRVMTAMVKRVMVNPDGLLSETVDDYSYRRDSAVSSGGLYVSADELAALTGQSRRMVNVRAVGLYGG